MVQGSFGGRKVREGTVVSDKMDKTVVVAVETRVRHPLYKKIVRRLRRHLAHDEINDAKLGDVVRIVESRPYSRHKRWRLAEVLIRAERPEVAAEDVDLELLGEVRPEKEEEEGAAPAEAVAEEAAPEGETAVPGEAAEEVPPVEQVVTAPETVEAQEAAAAPEPEAEAQAEEVSEAAAEPEAEARVEEAPEAEAEAQPEETPAPKAEEVTEAAAEEPEGEEKEGSS
jgi:small subunit ribosomal protein S17